jgi:hypothetical protein
VFVGLLSEGGASGAVFGVFVRVLWVEGPICKGHLVVHNASGLRP